MRRGSATSLGPAPSPQAVNEALVAKRPITVRLLNFRADRTLFVNDLTIVPLGSDGVVTHFGS